MVDLDPEIWNNKTLGSANNLPFLDEVSAQIIENRDAKSEGRKPVNKEFRNRFSNEALVGHLVDRDGEAVDPIDYETELAYQRAREDEKVDAEAEQQSKVSEKETKEAEDAKPVTPNRRTSSVKR